MPAFLILEFDGVGREQYNAVNERLGIDMETGAGEWPPGLHYHAAGSKPGGWAVLEVWETQEAQQSFMENRLGRALQEGGITDPPSRVQWVDLVVQHSLDG